MFTEKDLILTEVIKYIRDLILTEIIKYIRDKSFLTKY